MQLFFTSIPEKPKTIKEIIKNTKTVKVAPTMGKRKKEIVQICLCELQIINQSKKQLYFSHITGLGVHSLVNYSTSIQEWLEVF